MSEQKKHQPLLLVLGSCVCVVAGSVSRLCISSHSVVCRLLPQQSTHSSQGLMHMAVPLSFRCINVHNNRDHVSMRREDGEDKILDCRQEDDSDTSDDKQVPRLIT